MHIISSAAASATPAPPAIAIFGAGAWGTALACVIGARHRVLLWTRAESLATTINQSRVNPHYLPGIQLPDTILACSHLSEILEGLSADSLLIIATPVSGLRTTVRQIHTQFPQLKNLVWLCKGLESDSNFFPHQILADECPALTEIGVLSGPSFAQEVAQNLPCALTIAAHSPALQAQVLNTFHSAALRVYSTDDVIGVEVGGAVKNILAIAAGISDGLGIGANARAALITRGLAEITRLGVALGGRHETFMGLAGVGDLILTCTGNLSRNRQVGLSLAQGQALAQITTHLGHVAEGVRCAQAVRNLAATLQIEMPIVDAVCRVLFEGLTPRNALLELLARPVRSEA